MEEEIKMFLDEGKDLMEKAVYHTNRELAKIRAGKANPSLLEGLSVEYYGVPTPLVQVATVNTPDPRTLVIRPFERKMIAEIEKAIKYSDLGLTPQNDGEIVRLNIPALTAERRTQLVKQVKTEIEAGKVSIRNIRKDTNNALRELQKEGASEDSVKAAEEKIQKFTDQHIAQLDDISNKKEAELTTI